MFARKCLLAMLGPVMMTACQSAIPAAGQASAAGADPAEIRAIAREAYIYGYPVVEAYKTLYAQAVDPGGADFRAPINQIGNTARVFTPADKAFVTPNADTPYSFLWMDLRAEPMVLTLPEIPGDRYFSVQLVDIYTHSFAYLGTRATGNRAGSYMIVGPDWHGEKPDGVDAVIRSESAIAYALYRIQLFDTDDIGRVRDIQKQYKVATLSAFLGKPAPEPATPIAWLRPEAGMEDKAGFFRYLNFMLQFAPTHPSETALMARFAAIGVGPGKPFDDAMLPADTRQALEQGIADARTEQDDFRKTMLLAGKVSSADVFGSREHLRNNYMYRYSAAALGIFGNAIEEAWYGSYFVDGGGKPLNASATRYVLHFDKDKLPPANAFWSLTMYDGRTKLLVDNPLHRYLINSPMLGQLTRDADGGLTLYVQKERPEESRIANWLPAPDGPFYLALRLYLPKPEVVSGQWRQPRIKVAD